MNKDVKLKTLAKIGQGSRQPHLANMMILAEHVGFLTHYNININIVIIIKFNIFIVIIIIIIIMNVIFIIINFVVTIFVIIIIIIIIPIVKALCNEISNKY
jgi:hypothetical protein